MKITVYPDSLVLTTIVPIYVTKTMFHEPTNQLLEKKVFIKDLRTRKWIKKDAIYSVEHYINSKHKISPVRCVVLEKYGNNMYVVEHKMEEVINLLENVNSKIGFKNVN